MDTSSGPPPDGLTWRDLLVLALIVLAGAVVLAGMPMLIPCALSCPAVPPAPH